jgi:hypothetical protein
VKIDELKHIKNGKLDSGNDFVRKFLNAPLEREEIFTNYTDYSFGDLVLEFPNPDDKETAKAYSDGIDYKEAEHIFSTML